MGTFNRVTAAGLALALLAAVTAVSLHPYIAYGRAVSCELPSDPLSLEASFASSADFIPGFLQEIKVSTGAFARDYQDLRLGVIVAVRPQGAEDVTVGEAWSDSAHAVKKGSSLADTVKWMVPQALLGQEYYFKPVLKEGNSLVQTEVTVASAESSQKGAEVHLAGADARRVEVASGLIPAEESVSQQLVQFEVQNPTAASAEISVRWRLYSGMGGEEILKDEATYTQAAAPGISVTRQYFLDTSKVGKGRLEAELTSGDLVTKQSIAVNGSANPQISVSQTGFFGGRFAGVSRVRGIACLGFDSANQTEGRVKMSLVDAEGTVLWEKAVSSLGSKPAYAVTTYSLAMKWPLTLTATTFTGDQEIARSVSTYRQ